ncbi:hypothetical protein GCM10008965_09310 [Methylorubrum aminovorans]|nr:hypothetical protein GCM10025880_12490 [Methylorubrum aminovorans]
MPACRQPATEWAGGTSDALEALIADHEARRERQLSLLVDRAERLQDTADAPHALRLTEESLAALRSHQGYRRARATDNPLPAPASGTFHGLMEGLAWRLARGGEYAGAQTEA